MDVSPRRVLLGDASTGILSARNTSNNSNNSGNNTGNNSGNNTGNSNSTRGGNGSDHAAFLFHSDAINFIRFGVHLFLLCFFLIFFSLSLSLSFVYLEGSLEGLEEGFFEGGVERFFGGIL